MLTRRLLRLVVLVLVAGVAVVASAEARPVPDGRGAAVVSTVGDVAIVPTAVSDPTRLLVPVGLGGAVGVLLVVVVGAALRAAPGPESAAVDGRRRRWRSRLVGAPPVPASA